MMMGPLIEGLRGWFLVPEIANLGIWDNLESLIRVMRSFKAGRRCAFA